MLFSSIPFLYYFLPIVLIAYYLVPKAVKNLVLLLASLVFYGWGEPKLLFLMSASILLGYVFGILIEKFQNTKWSKVFLILSIAISLGFLGYYKYANFFVSSIASVTGIAMPVLHIALPIGISFYTFQLVSYIIDVYWQQVAAQKNLISLATYITMFPQLIAGPIVRYSDVEKQLSERSITFEKIAYGIRRFALGVGKKILIANVLGEFCSEFKGVDDKSIVFFWAYAIAVSLQIYFDFSGYSDMAIGLGSMLGFRFIENFNYPFISRSITEFWRRWHMSLGTWFRDYVYIPLGGSRCSTIKNLRNIFVVWMLTGLWHGAEWTFVAWGLYFGILLMIEKTFLLQYLKKYSVVGHIYVVFFVMLSFILFDASGFEQAFHHILSMFGAGAVPFFSASTGYFLRSYSVIFVIALIGATPIPKMLVNQLSEKEAVQKVILAIEPVVMILLLLVSTGYLVDGSFNPFLYFRF